MVNCFSCILGVAMVLASLFLTLQGHHYVNGYLVVGVLGFGGTVVLMGGIAAECWGL